MPLIVFFPRYSVVSVGTPVHWLHTFHTFRVCYLSELRCSKTFNASWNPSTTFASLVKSDDILIMFN